MAQETFASWNSASSSNSTIEGDATDGNVNIAEGCAPGNVNNAIRSIMAAANLAFGAFPSGTSRPAYLTAGRWWLNTTSATAPILTFYDGTDNIPVFTINYTANTITLSGSVTVPGALANIVEDTTPQLGGALDVNTFSITSASNGNVTIDPNGTGTIVLGAATVTVEDDITHAGDTDNKVTFGTDTQTFQTGGTSRLDISDSGVRMGAANARVTTILDEDAMSSNSATALATQQSIKAYVDTFGGGITRGTPSTTTGGTAVDFSIAAGVDKVLLMLAGVSQSGTDNLLVQLGDSGGIETSSYTSSCARITNLASSTSGFLITNQDAAAASKSGFILLTRLDGNQWVAGGVLSDATPFIYTSAGNKTLSAELTTVRLTVTGANTFDAMAANVFTET